jgi:D-cysteine desulfhydrase family pyridoxal phosphate-dependent enzyme
MITLPRIPLAYLPTPVQPLPRLSAELGGPQLWIKRDDLTGLAFGGNKTRKLEFLLAEAQAHGARTLITRGAIQSNHCRQTAAAAANQGFECILVLTGSPPKTAVGNTLLDQLMGAEMIWTEGEDPDEILDNTFEAAWSGGRRPYLIPYGGSNPIGAASYAAAMGEFMEQDTPVDRIVFATSSGGTQAGLLVGAHIYHFSGLISGISVDPLARAIVPTIASLATETAELLGQPKTFLEKQVDVNDKYLGEGYAVMGKLEKEALGMFARLEGLFLDPVYTGRAAGGMINLIRSGEISSKERVLFWHTGGTPALFAYAEELSLTNPTTS